MSEFKLGMKVKYKGEIHEVYDVDEGYEYLALSGDKYIAPNHGENRCISAPFFECEPIKEQKMEKQKYKYVDAGIKTVGELVDRLLNDEELYNKEGKPINYETLYKYELRKLREIVLDRITTRQPLPWYEVEGVFPCLVECFGYKFPIIVTEFKSDFGVLVAYNDLKFHAADCTPLSPEEAAKYGVDA